MVSLKKYALFFIPFLLLLVSLAGFFLFRISFLQRAIETKDKSLADLDQKLTLLEKAVDQQPEVKQEKLEKQTVSGDQPFIIFVPAGKFSEDEKKELVKKLVDPLIDFNAQENISFLSIVITLITEADKEGDFRYDVSTLDKDGNYGGFLYGEDKKLEWWIPDCLEKCNFLDDFTDNYPEIVEIYQEKSI